MELVLIANPENRRATFFVEALKERGGRCRVVPWLDLLRGAPTDGTHIRVESPGESWAVESALLATAAPEDRGRIRGLDRAYARMCEALGALPADARYMNAPAAIAAMFDKVETKRRLAEAGLDVPQTVGIVRTFDELREAVRAAQRSRVFVKPRHGSSASGVMALSMRGAHVEAVTSVERVDDRLYNSLKLRRYRGATEVSGVVDLLGREDDLLVEEWVPKASTQGATCDLRVVAIAAAAEHAVLRLSKSPLTNLHLGNFRGDLAALRARLGDRWAQVEAVAVGALRAFDGALYAGIDIGLTPDLRRVTVFEVNAFGDLLPGVHDARGRTTYAAELDAFLPTDTGS